MAPAPAGRTHNRLEDGGAARGGPGETRTLTGVLLPRAIVYARCVFNPVRTAGQVWNQ